MLGRAKRNLLVIEAIPWAKAIANTYCYMHQIFGANRNDIHSDAYWLLLVLAETYKPERGPTWKQYVNYTLEKRIIDLYRIRIGRSDGVNAIVRNDITKSLVHAVPPETLQFVATGDPIAEILLAQSLAIYLATLNQRDRYVITRRLDGMRLNQIGLELGISESRISQILTRLKPGLKDYVINMEKE